jgi:hypothetical protein
MNEKWIWLAVGAVGVYVFYDKIKKFFEADKPVVNRPLLK